MANKYDTIIIGSGAGGLTAAVALANAGQKVLICEQHDTPGGWTHSFTLDGHRYSPGVHYIGGLSPGEHLDKIYRGLGVSADMEFIELNPDGFDHIFIGSECFDIPKGKVKYMNRLIERFPNEEKGIRALFSAIDDISLLMRKAASGKLPLNKIGSIKWLWKSAQDLADSHLNDPILKAIILSQAGDYGVPPSKTSSLVQVGIIRHYFNGGFYPKGGAFIIPRAYVRALKRAGGEIRLSTPVNKILIDNGKTTGVEIADGEKIHSKNVISNTDPENTFVKLIGREYLSAKLNKKLDKTQYSTSCLSLYLAVDMDLAKRGYDSGNYWFYNHADLDEIYKQGRTDFSVFNEPSAMFMTITTLKDPSKMKKGLHSIEAFSFANYEPFEKWADEPSGNRSKDYVQFKNEIMERMLNFLDKRVPDISKSVAFKELGTPLTNAHYLNSYRGNIYGTDKIKSQLGPLGYTTKTEIKNLYLCGASTLSHGVAGATATGLQAAAKILNCKTKELLKQNGPEIKIY